MKILLPIIFSVTVSCVLNGCIPVPHRRTVMPLQNGVLLFNGKPLEGVRIIQSFAFKDKFCENAEFFTVTDKEGKFSFKERRETFLFVSMGDQHFHSYICAEYQGKNVYLVFQDVNHEREKPSNYRCDLANKIPCKIL